MRSKKPGHTVLLENLNRSIMSEDARQSLAAKQTELVAALIGKDDPPAGCDGSRLAEMSRTLQAKRARAAARCWPALAASLGQSFRAKFDQYATESAHSNEDAIVDGLKFI